MINKYFTRNLMVIFFICAAFSYAQATVLTFTELTGVTKRDKAKVSLNTQNNVIKIKIYDSFGQHVHSASHTAQIQTVTPRTYDYQVPVTIYSVLVTTYYSSESYIYKVYVKHDSKGKITESSLAIQTIRH